MAEKDPNLLTALFSASDFSKRQIQIKDTSTLLKRSVSKTGQSGNHVDKSMDMIN